MLANAPLNLGPSLPIPRIAVDKGTADMPLGLLYLAASLKENAFEDVRVLDALTMRLDPVRAAEEMAGHRPDLLGISVFSFSCADVAALATQVRARLPGCHICLGGPHTSAYPAACLAHDWCDSVCVGYGEQSIVELAQALREGENDRKIPGIGRKHADTAGSVPGPRPPGDINAIPFPDRTLVDRRLYSSWVVDRPLPATGVLTSRGCPFGCAFCSQSRTPFAQRTVHNVLEEVERCREQGFKMIYFQDDTMNLDRDWMLSFAHGLVAMTDRPAWCFRGRVSGFDDELAQACTGAGCVRVQFGIEAGSEEVQRSMGKGIDLAEALSALRAARRAGIATVCYFIMGFPGETRAQMRETYRFARRLDPDFAIFSPLYLLPATKLYERERTLRGNTPDPYEEYTRYPTDGFVPPPPSGTIPRRDVFRMVKLAYLPFYFSPRFLLSGKGTGGGVWRGIRGGLSVLGYALFGLRRWR